jgi:hypothetical protein
MAKRRRRRSRYTVDHNIISERDGWIVWCGWVEGKTRGAESKKLFRCVGEKLPWASLPEVSNNLKSVGMKREGVYLAHDSFGVARYGGRGNIFHRLRSHKRKYQRELVYYSFYIIEDKTHEREIENVILRAAGPQLVLNQRKVRDGIEPGSVRDYEPGTRYYRRRLARGQKRIVRFRRGRR